jgi:hypothetical protein
MNFERVIIIRNPVSTHAERAAKYVKDVRAQFASIEVVVLKTVRGGIEANEARLREHDELFDGKTLVGVVAGDGTFNMVVTILQRLGAYNATLVPLWGGNANDLAHMLNGRAPRSLRALFNEAQTINVRPLACTLTLPDGSKETRLAICYASFGASAAAARRLGEVIRTDHPSHVVPGVRFVREMGSGWRTLKHAQLFMVRENDTTRPLFEAAFFNGSRFAKVKALPLRLTDEHFFGSILETRSMSALLLRIAQLTNRRSTPKFIRTHASFVVEENITAQFDGETVQIAAGTLVAISLAARPISALSRL